MGTTLTGTTPASTYDSLIKVTDNGPLSGTAKYLSDGLGNDSALALSNARVGIGTNNPNVSLEIYKSDYPSLRLSGASGFSNIYQDLAGAIIYSADDSATIANSGHIFYVDGSESMRITSAGNVGIGTSSPSDQLEVAGNIRANVSNGGGFMLTGSSASGLVRNAATGLSLRTNTTDRLTIDLNGNVGIGTDSPSMKLELLASASVNLTGNAYYSSRFLQDKSNYRGVFLGYDSTAQKGIVGSESAGAASSLAFYTYNGATWAERAAITSNGITFNGDTAAANALDDYEEGNWTPTINFSGASVGVTYNFNVGRYTKIGNKVTANCFLSVSDKGTSTGSLAVGGLPFALASGTANYNPVSIRPSGISFADQIIGYAEEAATQILLQEVTMGGAVTSISEADCATAFSAMLQITYFV